MNIVVISGSPRKASISKRVALNLYQTLINTTEHTVQLLDVKDWNLGLLEQVFTSVEETPQQYKVLAQTMFSADAFILVTPEYNGSFSAALQNLFDHFPKQSRKAFGIVTASTGALGGMRSAQQLLLLVPALFGIASPHLLVTPFMDKKFDAAGNLLDESFKKNIDNFLNEFLWLAQTLKQEMVLS